MGEAGPMGQVQAILPQLKIGDAIGAAIPHEHECVRSNSACQLIHSRPVAHPQAGCSGWILKLPHYTESFPRPVSEMRFWVFSQVKINGILLPEFDCEQFM
jgi:hypothetical protein